MNQYKTTVSHLACLRMILGMHGLVLDEDSLSRKCGTTTLGTSANEVVQAARDFGFRARKEYATFDALRIFLEMGFFSDQLPGFQKNSKCAATPTLRCFQLWRLIKRLLDFYGFEFCKVASLRFGKAAAADDDFFIKRIHQIKTPPDLRHSEIVMSCCLFNSAISHSLSVCHIKLIRLNEIFRMNRNVLYYFNFICATSSAENVSLNAGPQTVLMTDSPEQG